MATKPDFAADDGDDDEFEIDITKDPVYADLTPILQDDGPNPVVAIRYNEDFVNVHNYFRAIIHRNELSMRALKLTEKVIRLNAANYTAWQYRRECIFKLEYDLQKELRFSKEIAENSPKNYQLWWHRRIIIEALNKPLPTSSAKANANANDDEQEQQAPKKPTEDSAFAYDLQQEKELLHEILKADVKNYHAWSHYHWLLRAYNLYDGELEYLEKRLLTFDVRNNSAWNHRHFVVKQTSGFKSMEILQREIEFCRSKIKALATNHAVWYYYTQIVCQYLKDLCRSDDTNHAAAATLSWNEHRQEQMKWVQSIIDKQPYAPRAFLFYVDLLTDKECATPDNLNQAKQCLTLLAEKVDRIRHNYYKYLIQELDNQ